MHYPRKYGNPAPSGGALDGFILRDELLYHVHIRTGGIHRNRDHINPEIFGDAEMTVIPRNRAEKFHLIEAAPRRVAHDTVRISSGDRVVHDIE